MIMKIVCFIDNLCSGGAQRQLIELASGLELKGEDVYMVYYYDRTFFKPVLSAANIEIIRLKNRNKLERIYRFREVLDAIKPDIVQSYLHGPGMVAEIVSICKKRWKLIVSERNIYSHKHQQTISYIIGRQLHRLADWIVVNSYANSDLLCNQAKHLRGKISVIWNCVDLERFHPNRQPTQSTSDKVFKFICVASMTSAKNAPMVARALYLLRQKTKKPFRLHWIGRIDSELHDHVETFKETEDIIKRYQLENVFIFESEKDYIEKDIRESDALVLCSKYEGLPNAVCEGMASGLPIVASRVSDNDKFITEDKNGFLCDPNDEESIAESMRKCLELTEAEFDNFKKEPDRIKKTKLAQSVAYLVQVQSSLIKDEKNVEERIKKLEELAGIAKKSVIIP